MAKLTVTIPDEHIPQLVAAIEAEYGDAVDGLSNAQKGQHAARQHFKSLYRKHARKAAPAVSQAVTDAQAAEAAARQALSDLEAARKAAETTADAQAITDTEAWT